MTAFWLVLAGLSWGGPVDDINLCLDKNDVPCAEAVVASSQAVGSEDPDLLAAAAQTAYYGGHYPEAYDLIVKAVARGYADRWQDLALYERTLYTTAGWTEAAQGRFRVRYRPGPDAVIIDEAFRVLNSAEKNVVPLLGAPPPGTTILEVHPTGYSFIAASSLTKDAVMTTNTVALSKWSRLLLTSPRALGRGYDWQDTLSHEYVHLVVAHNTDDHAPVWLQEATAKYIEARWVDGKDHFALDPRSKTLLGEALAKDELVPFRAMHPSLAMLPTIEQASLAYAQLGSLMSFCFNRKGDGFLLDLLPRVQSGTDPMVAMAAAAGFPDFPSLEVAWKAWLRTQSLGNAKVGDLPTVLDGAGSDADGDPVMAKRRDLANYVRIGDLLAQAKKADAALVEYAKADDPSEPRSPLLANRRAQALAALSRTDEARLQLEDSVKAYPNYVKNQVLLGELYAKSGRRPQAIEVLADAARRYPYDPKVHRQLVTLYGVTGDAEKKAHHEHLLQILEHGGEDGVLQVIHQREGVFELPRDPKKVEGGEHPVVGKSAPPLRWTDARTGDRVSIEDMAGKVVVVDFWATWCGPCKASMPEIQALHDRLGAKGVAIVGVSSEDARTVKRFLAENTAIRYPIGFLEKDAAKYWSVDSLPTLFVVRPDGKVHKSFTGFGPDTARDLEAAIGEAMSDEPGLRIIKTPPK